MEFSAYSEYKHSGVEWLGEVPSHWQNTRFKHVFFEKKHTQNMDLPFGAISFGKVVFKEDRANLTEELKANYQEVRQGEFLINPLNLNYDLKSLRTALSKIDVVVSSGYIVLDAKDDRNSKAYLEYLLYIFDIFHMKSMGAGIRQTINFNDIGKSEVSLPPINEQNQIAQFLDKETAKIDELIAKQEQLIVLLEEQRKSVISYAVTKGLNPNAPMKDSGVEWLGEVPKHWQKGRLKDFCKLITDKTSEKTNVITLENIESWTGKFIPTDAEFESDAVTFKANDVLFGKLRPYLAKVYLAENDGQALGDIYVLRANNLIEAGYLKFLLLSQKFIDLVNSSTNGVKMPRANWDFLGLISIFLPEVEEQKRIIDFILDKNSKIDNLIQKQQELITQLKEYRTSVISHAVTGKIDIRGLV